MDIQSYHKQECCKVCNREKFEEPLECIRIGELEMEIWKYGNMEIWNLHIPPGLSIHL